MASAKSPAPGRDVAQEILDSLETKDALKSSTDFPNVSQPDFKGALDRLGSRSMIEYTTFDSEQVLLTDEGLSIVEEGSHEYKVWDAVRRLKKIEIKDLAKTVGESAKVGQNNAMKSKWVKKDGSALVVAADTVEDQTRQILQHVQETKSMSDSKLLSEYKKRKLVKTAKVISYSVVRGPKYSKTMPVEATELTAEMIASGSWRTTAFKPYNFDSRGAPQGEGALHPLNKMRSELRDIFFYTGFTEMPTSRYVESGFWNFDTLFVPQQHPARELQDTFYVSDPPKADKPRADPEMEEIMDKMEGANDKLYSTTGTREPRDYETYWKNTRAIHEQGAFGSIGYRYPWSEDECLRLCLRTHTTALTTWVLHRLAKKPRPAKYFSIDRVFRNESLDATHLAEFHQVEGVIAEYDLSLVDGQGFLKYFYEKLGIHDIKFKPAYNPYTEPSMEVFGYHEGLKRWIEIGNSGVFRPEMLEAMGLPKNLRVFGFGLSVERPAMIKYAVNNIRELVGHKVSLDFIQGSPAIRLDKD